MKQAMIWKSILAGVVLAGVTTRGLAQELDLGRALEGVDLSAFGEIDPEQVKEVCRDLQGKLQGDYVVDLAAVREIAAAVLPLLEKSPDTQPYAAWLRTRLDYLAVAEELRVTIPAPKLELTPPPAELPPINPSPELERQI